MNIIGRKHGATALVTAGGIGGISYALAQMLPLCLQTVGEAVCPVIIAGWTLIWPWLGSTIAEYGIGWNNARKVRQNEKKIAILRRMMETVENRESRQRIREVIRNIEIENVQLIAD
jgi:hypothetical protein